MLFKVIATVDTMNGNGVTGLISWKKKLVGGVAQTGQFSLAYTGPAADG